jgi:transcriptional regulator with XRE-family HTH domain
VEIYKKWFGKRLIELREQAGYRTQDKFAEAVGVKNASASRWETGDSFPGKKHFAKICKVLRVDANEFLEFPNVDKSVVSIDDAISVLETFRDTTPVRRDFARAVLSGDASYMDAYPELSHIAQVLKELPE